MKLNLRVPFFEVGVKNYIYGDAVLELAKVAEAASIKYDIDVLFTTPYVDMRRLKENCPKLFILAPYMDTLRPGRGQADIMPEAIHAAGAQGVMVNHCERPMSLPQIKETIERAHELGMFVFGCADTIAETKAIAQLHPDIINPEPSELIGTTSASDLSYVKASIKAVKDIYPDILVEVAAGITTAQQVYDNIMEGADAVGSASGIVNSPDPHALADDMIRNVRLAWDDLQKTKK